MPEVTERYVRVPVATKKDTDEIRTISISAKQGIKALYARNRRVIITYLFALSHGWTLSKAKKWVDKHDGKTKKKIFRGGELVKAYGSDIDILLEPFDDNDDLIKALEAMFLEAKTVGWNEGLEEVGKDTRLIPDRLLKEVREAALEASKLISGTVKENVAQLIIDGFNLGDTTNEIAERVGELIEAPLRVNVAPSYNPDGTISRRGYTRELPTRVWAEIVARTETNKVATSSILESFKSAGYKKAQWFVNPGACEICQPFDGKTFDLESVKGMIPYHPNCRCTWMPVVQKQIAGRIHTGIKYKGREIYLDE